MIVSQRFYVFHETTSSLFPISRSPFRGGISSGSESLCRLRLKIPFPRPRLAAGCACHVINDDLRNADSRSLSLRHPWKASICPDTGLSEESWSTPHLFWSEMGRQWTFVLGSRSYVIKLNTHGRTICMTRRYGLQLPIPLAN